MNGHAKGGQILPFSFDFWRENLCSVHSILSLTTDYVIFSCSQPICSDSVLCLCLCILFIYVLYLCIFYCVIALVWFVLSIGVSCLTNGCDFGHSSSRVTDSAIV